MDESVPTSARRSGYPKRCRRSYLITSGQAFMPGKIAPQLYCKSQNILIKREHGPRFPPAG